MHIHKVIMKNIIQELDVKTKKSDIFAAIKFEKELFYYFIGQVNNNLYGMSSLRRTQIKRTIKKCVSD